MKSVATPAFAPVVRTVGLLPLFSLLIAAGLGHQLCAQAILHQWSGISQPGPYGDTFGWAIAGVGDVNGDGTPDVAVGADSTHVGAMQYAGRLYVFSGSDGSTLFTLDGTAAFEGLAFRLEAVGDMDRDGHADMLAWSGALHGMMGYHLVSGRTATIIHSYPNYVNAAGIGDVDNDGWPDLMFGSNNTGAMGQLGPGYVDVISGQSGAIIRTYNGSYPGQWLGWPIASAGDVDGDGIQDLLIGAKGNYPWLGSDGIWVYSGSTGGLIFRRPPQGPTDSFPWALAGVGDVNGDGLDDVAVSDHGIRQWNNYSNIVAFGFGGPTGTQLLTIPGVNQIMGYTVAGPGDVDGDGFDDLLQRGLGLVSGLAQLYSGQNQSLLVSFPAGGPCAKLGDVNGDDFPDYLVGGFPGPTGLNVVRVYSGAPPGVTTLGRGCASSSGVIPRIGCTYVPARGSQFALNLTRVRSGAPALLVLGQSSTLWGSVPLPLELSLLDMPGCYLRVAADVSTATSTVGPPAKGRASHALQIPNDPALAGATFHAMWFVLEPPGTAQFASATRALAVTIQ